MTPTTTKITIKAPNIREAVFHIRGTAPLMLARFSKRDELARVMEGPQTPGRKRERTPRDYDAEAAAATYTAEPGGWHGFNAAGLRSACISACRLAGFKMTVAKISVFVVADGTDPDRTPLVRITLGTPATTLMSVRNATGVMDIRSRPLWEAGWEAKPTIRWDGDQFGETDIYNLVMRAGLQVGIGEGRPDSRESAGLGYGLFEIVAMDEQSAVR
jgi:hypothetical protein